MQLIRPISDIHNEFSVYNLPVLETDARSALLLAGDICVAESSSTLTLFLDAHADRFQDVLFIPGNHEYYHGSLRRVDDKLGEICSRYENVHYMNRRAETFNGVRYICATLWTDYRGGDPMVMMAAQGQMNDYVQIRTGPPGFPYQRPLKAIDILPLHRDHRFFIEEELKRGNEDRAAGKCNSVVVMTHHSMSFQSRPPQEVANFRHGPLDYAYYNVGMEDMIEKYEPDVIVHGHSHFPVDMMLGKTRLVSNPRGYSKTPDGYESLDFRSSFVIEL